MKIKVIYVISKIDKALEFEWVAEYLDSSKFDLSYVLLNKDSDSSLYEFLRKKNIPVINIKYSGKKDIIISIIKLMFHLFKEKPHIVHTHLFDANFVGLVASWLVGTKRRIYTRHYSSINHVYYPKAVKIDKLFNFLATDIVAISGKVKEILVKWENADAEKIVTICHGLEIKEFMNRDSFKVQKLKDKYGIKKQYPVIGVISKYTHWKGIQYIIPAYELLLKKYPNALLILANAGKGEYMIEIARMLKEIPSKNYIEIVFEKDLYSLYGLFNLFIHVPIDNHSEAFGQVYIESMAAGIPGIYTKSGIGNEILENKINALVVNYKDSGSIYNAISFLLENLNKIDKFVKSAQQYVIKNFTIYNKIKNLEKLYSKPIK